MYIGNMDTGRDTPTKFENPKISIDGDEGEDKYTAGIELSNACRRFYVSRLQAAQRVKQKLNLEVKASLDLTGEDSNMDCPNCAQQNGDIWEPRTPANHRNLGSQEKLLSRKVVDLPKAIASETPKPKSNAKSGSTGIEAAMSTLKKEMASLIDQDLALMRQLLTLNEQIEELKWQRKLQGYSKGSLASSYNWDSSLLTLSDADFDFSEFKEPLGKYPSPSSLSLYKEKLKDSMGRLSSMKELDSRSDIGSNDSLMKKVVMKNAAQYASSSDYAKDSGDQQSFDSGIHEPETVQTEIMI